jgi:uncharacterized protein
MGIIKNIDELLKGKVVELLDSRLKPIIIYVFGSYATGELREDSDIDIAFLSDEEFSAYEVFLIAQEVADILGRDVDLVDLKQASTVFKAQIVGKGIIIFCSDETRKAIFQMMAFKEYAMLNEDRQIILESIRKRGSVYGD